LTETTFNPAMEASLPGARASFAVTLGYRLPVGSRRATKRIDADLQAGRADRLEIDDVGKVLHVRHDEVLRVSRGRLEGSVEANTLNTSVAGTQEIVSAVLNPVGDVGIGRSSIRRVVLEAAVAGWVVRRGNDDAVSDANRPVPIMR
jgi:hypothetical protein